MQDIVVMRKPIVLICFLTVSVKYHLKKKLANTYHTKKAKRQGDGEPNTGSVSLAESMFFSCSLIFSQCSFTIFTLPHHRHLSGGQSLSQQQFISADHFRDTENVSWPHCNVQKTVSQNGFLALLPRLWIIFKWMMQNVRVFISCRCVAFFSLIF